MEQEQARQIISDHDAREILTKQKIEIDIDDNRSPVIFVAEAIIFALQMQKAEKEAQQAQRLKRQLGYLSSQDTLPYFG